MNKWNYYNDSDPHVCAWVRELIKAGLVPDGEVDERSIKDVSPNDLRGFVQCHFFCGILGWPLALDLAGWPRNRPAWTGSCPCQPFSAAGKGKAQSDDRHLWPVWFDRLISKCRPDTIFGEQVNAAIRHGWLDGICADLEGAGYAVGQVVLGAHSTGSPHIRQRLYWVAQSHSIGRHETQTMHQHRRLADSNGERRDRERLLLLAGRSLETMPETSGGSGTCRLANADGGQSGDRGIQPGGEQRQQPQDSGVGGLEYAEGDRREQRRTESDRGSVASGCGNSWLGSPSQPGSQGHAGDGNDGSESGRIGEVPIGPTPTTSRVDWLDSYWHQCRDGKARRVPDNKNASESIFQLISDGIPGIMGAGWIGFIDRIKERINDHAKTEKTRPGKVLRAVWVAYATDALRANAGGLDEVQSSKILLVALCELARGSQSEFEFTAQDFSEIRKATVRIVWGETTLACASQERGLEGPQTGQPSNALHPMSPWGCSQETGETLLRLRQEIKTVRNVPKALSACEKVWESIVDKKKKTGDRKRIRDGIRMLSGTHRFPLSDGFPERVGLLRGAGNAIVPQVAAAFIQAFLESE